MTNQFFLNGYDFDSNEFSPDYINYLDSLSDDELRKELFFVKQFHKDFCRAYYHCCSIYQLHISEKIIDMIKTNRYPSESDLLDISRTCKEMADYLGSLSFPTDKDAYNNYPDYWGYFSGCQREQMMDLIIEAAKNCASLREDYGYAIYKLNQTVGFNDYVLGRDVTDEHALKTIENALAVNDLKSIGIVKTENGYDLMERIKHIEKVLEWLFYQYIG